MNMIRKSLHFHIFSHINMVISYKYDYINMNMIPRVIIFFHQRDALPMSLVSRGGPRCDGLPLNHTRHTLHMSPVALGAVCES